MAWISTPTGWVEVLVPGYDSPAESAPIPQPPAGFPTMPDCPPGSHYDPEAGGCVADDAVSGPTMPTGVGTYVPTAVSSGTQGRMLGAVRLSAHRAGSGEMSEPILGPGGSEEFPRVQYGWSSSGDDWERSGGTNVSGGTMVPFAGSGGGGRNF